MLEIQAHSFVQTLFPNKDSLSKRIMLTLTQLELFSLGFKSMKVSFSIFPDQHNNQILTQINHYGPFWRIEKRTCKT
jgi:hypothetical protein